VKLHFFASIMLPHLNPSEAPWGVPCTMGHNHNHTMPTFKQFTRQVSISSAQPAKQNGPESRDNVTDNSASDAQECQK